MFDVEEWLNKIQKDGNPLHRRISFLVTANGGFEVGSWGYIAHGGIHQQGLEQEDALELMQISAFMQGLDAAEVPVLDKFMPHFKEYQEEIKQRIESLRTNP